MTKIILHLGAHRTASTHVQGVLGKNVALLAKERIVAPCQDDVKSALTKPLGARMPSAHVGFAALLKGAAPETVVISDENLLGFLNSIFSHGKFYPDTASRLAGLRQMLPIDPAKIVVAIRPYDGFFASAYGRWLAPGRMVLPREAVAEIALNCARGWRDVLEDIAAAFPLSKLVISEYSPNPRFGPAQLNAILGPLAEQLFYNPDYRWNRSMSARQTVLYEQAVEAGDTEKAVEIRTWKRFKQPELLDEFWDEPTRKTLQARYFADKTAIIERFPAFVTAQSFAEQDAG